jgi:uncharacterized protein (DUF2141 family)
MKRILLSIVPIITICIIAITGSTGCANIIPPSGGPRDSLPPVLVSANPKDSTTNFRGNRIILTFDEYIDLQDVQQNLLFTPIFETNPVIEAKLRTLTLKLKDSLEANTTYTFNFGNAIKDINESNVLRNFTYTFSTGPALDSLTLSGKVILAETGKIDTTLIVVLHNTFEDSVIAKKRPRYVTRLDGSGNFTFKNLPADTFAVYALSDVGGQRKYTSTSQLFAFNNTPVKTTDSTSKNITLYAYKETNGTQASTPATRPAANDKRLRFTTNLTRNEQDLGTNLVITTDAPLRFFDSSKIQFSTDSTFTAVTAYRAVLDSLKKNITISTAWKPGTPYHLILNKDFAEDTIGRRLLKTDTLHFTTKGAEDYGSIAIRMRNINPALNPVLQFVQNDIVVFSAPIKSGRFEYQLFNPGDYDLRILYDTNNNGKWDPGQFFGTKKQPELAVPVQRKITVKPNWENEFEINL